MTDQSLFEEDKPQETPEQKPTQDNFNDLLKTITNENGEQKYANVEEAFKGLKNAQDYIPELKTKLEAQEKLIGELTEQTNQSKSLEAIVEQLKTNQETTQETPPQSGSLDAEGVLKILEQREAQATLEQNQNKVNQEFVKIHGEKAKEVLDEKLSKLGMTKEAFKSLSQTSPQAALKLVEDPVQQKVTVTTSTNSTSWMDTPIKKEEGLQPPEKSLMEGATSQEQAAYMQKVQEEVMKKYNVT